MSEALRPITIYGEWHYYAGFIYWSLKQNKIDHSATVQPEGFVITTPHGRITLLGERETTTIHVDQVQPPAVEQWAALLHNIKILADETREARHQALGRTYDEAIEGYYRAKARGTKITLRQVAAATDLDYGYLREKKSEYDRRGGWGSKSSDKRSDK